MTTVYNVDFASDVIRELGGLFKRHAGDNSNVIRVPQIREALNSISLYPSKFQIYELVLCACENNGRTPADHLTFGEFSLLVVELRENYKKINYNYTPPVPPCRLQDKQANALLERRNSRRVFLGGSCKPTTWRDDYAVPYFSQCGISFYNPEVPEWNEQLIELEDRARQTAEILFFVIDNQTRSTASLVEAAYLAGCGRQLVLVIKAFEGKVIVKGEVLSDKEVEGLERSRAYLTDLVERSGIPIFSDLQDALKSTSRIVKENLLVSDLSKEDGVWPVRFPYVRVADRFMKMFECFHDIDPVKDQKIDLNGVDRAYRCLTGYHLPSDFAAANADKLFSFDDFCLIVVECRYCPIRSMPVRILENILNFPSKIAGWFLPRKQPTATNSDLMVRDVFLGGTCGTSTWRDQIVIPKLKSHGLTYYNPQVAHWSVSFIPIEAEAKDHSQVLLYVIGRESRGVTSMLEVAYYIGRGCDIVLCIEYLPEDAAVEGELLTAVAVSDYNRARTYLKDLANRDGVPVFDKVDDAVDHIIGKFQRAPPKNNSAAKRCK